MTGSEGVDVLLGSSEANNISGGAGNDTLIGDTGDDIIFGGVGIDEMRGGKGVTLSCGYHPIQGLRINQRKIWSRTFKLDRAAIY